MINNRSAKLLAYFLVLCFFACVLTACYSGEEQSNQNNVQQTTENSETEESAALRQQEKTERYVLNIRSKKIHKPTCGTGDLISPENRKTYAGNIEDLFRQGYTVCGNCFR